MTVTRDSPWDEDERALQVAYDENVCPECGNLRSVCSDPTIAWYPQRLICYNRATVELTTRRMSRGTDVPGWGPHLMDGSRVYAAEYDVNPDDDFIPKSEKKRH